MATAKKSCAKTGGVRFSEDHHHAHHHAAGASSHVHFDEKLHDSVVMVTPQDDGNFMVKVGFLKTQHKYEIVFTLPEVPALGKNVCPAPIPSPHLRITNISPQPDGELRVTCEYMAQQEGVLCEEVLLLSETNDDVCVKVKVHARVMVGTVYVYGQSHMRTDGCKHITVEGPEPKRVGIFLAMCE